MPDAKRFGDPVPNWTAPEGAPVAESRGHYVQLESLDAEKHAAELFLANSVDDGIWDYLPYGPFHSASTYHRWVRSVSDGVADPSFYAFRSLDSGKAVGVGSYLRIAPAQGSVEVGHLNFSAPLQGTRAATEAMYLMMKAAFAAGYRRYEWKCDALNLPSRRAAQRLGFSYEGVFRQHLIYKGRNRDTAWFAITDGDWPALKVAFETWLSPRNFDTAGQQQERLSDMTNLVRVSSDPAL